VGEWVGVFIVFEYIKSLSSEIHTGATL
jgi:hypothetical protein